MSQHSSIAFTDRTSSSTLRARAAVFAPVISAVLSLSSFAHAEPPAENPAPVVAAPTAPAPIAESPAGSAPVAASAAAPAPAAPSAAVPAPAAAPAPVSVEHEAPRPGRVHEGFYLRLASGPSVMSLRGHGPSGSASLTGGGETGSIVIGGALVPGLVLAGTVQGGSTDAEFKGGPFRDATLTVNGETRSASHHAQASFGMVGLLLDWYPQPRAGWHAGVATGIGAVGVKNSADNSTFTGVNLNGSLFGGYDWTLGRDWALGLQLTASGGTRTKLLEDSGDHDTGYRLTPVSLGIQASVLYF